MEAAAISLHIPSVGATTDDEFYISWPFLGKWVLDYVGFAPATAVAEDTTEIRTSTIAVNAGVASTSWSTVCSHTSDTDLTGHLPYVIGTVIEPTVTPRELRRGYQIRVSSVHGGATGKVHDGTYVFSATKVN